MNPSPNPSPSPNPNQAAPNSFDRSPNPNPNPNQAAPNSWAIKYYKGLGTSTSVEAKQYFSNLSLHELTFTWSGPERRAARTKPTL